MFNINSNNNNNAILTLIIFAIQVGTLGKKSYYVKKHEPVCLPFKLTMKL